MTKMYSSLGARLPAAGQFYVIFFEKKAILMPLNHILARVQSHLKELDF